MNIYITLDYELFLNDYTGDIDHCLILPTRELLKVLDKHQVKATFFIDAAYIYRLNELRDHYIDLQEDYEKVVNHVKEIASQGQKIGLHLHPQWFFSYYDGNKWIVDFDHYKLSDMEDMDACQRFRECKIILEEIIGNKIDSFRAGGYSIQTFKPFSSLMKDCGIQSDSSVLFKSKNLSSLHYYDYSSVLTSDSYSFTEDVAVSDRNGSFREYPISTTSFNYLTYCLIRGKMKNMEDNQNWGNGGDLPSRHRNNFLKNVFRKMIKPINMSASIDYQSFMFLNSVFSKYEEENKKDFVIIGHPKNLSPASLKMLSDFLDKYRTRLNFRLI